ncbi:hypothetical protein [Helicovermis profundi]|uniref:Uncharacterized protein n=1 Tax=Helicovermis profundi TaxID=3065157 RepID=A0AAU9EJK5_9FIRM|nr:hypothetical protein HLPR_20940 [Clostridia bacterium S502]
MGKVKRFNLFEIKQNIDKERYEKNKNRKETLGEKLVKLFVVLITSSMFLSLTWSFTQGSPIFYALLLINILIFIYAVYKILLPPKANHKLK